MDPDRRAAIARGMEAATIDATFLREDLMEAHDDAQQAYRDAQPDTYWVSQDMAILKLRDRTRVVKFHRTECRHFGVAVADRMSVVEQQIPVRGYEECEFCADLSITEWSHGLGLDPSVVSAIMRGSKQRVRKRSAVKIFRAIGLEPHPSLLEYVRTR